MLLAPWSFPVTYNAFEVLLEFFNSLIDSVLSSVGRKVELQESNMVGSCVLQAKSIHSFFSFFFSLSRLLFLIHSFQYPTKDCVSMQM